MSATVIQFVPRPNPNRDANLSNPSEFCNHNAIDYTSLVQTIVDPEVTSELAPKEPA